MKSGAAPTDRSILQSLPVGLDFPSPATDLGGFVNTTTATTRIATVAKSFRENEPWTFVIKLRS